MVKERPAGRGETAATSRSWPGCERNPSGQCAQPCSDLRGRGQSQTTLSTQKLSDF